MTSILVLGGGGPIGSAIGRRSAVSGVVARVTTRRDVDVADFSALRDIVAETGPGAIVDLVGAHHATGVPGPEHEAKLAENVIRAASQGGVRRVIHASSAAVYGDKGSTPFTESSPLLGSSDYAGLKITAEREIRESALAHGVDALSARIFNVYGPGCRNSLINKLRGPEKPALVLGGRFIRDYVHVDDVADALLAACSAELVGVVNVASGHGVDNRALASVVGGDAYVDAGVPADSFSVGNTEFALSLLNWRSRTSVLDYLSAGS